MNGLKSRRLGERFAAKMLPLGPLGECFVPMSAFDLKWAFEYTFGPDWNDSVRLWKGFSKPVEDMA